MTSFIITTLSILMLAAVCTLGGCTAQTNTKTDRAAIGAMSEGYICPLTGEELPCPKCCPLNQE